MSVVAIIPVRSNSKELPHKNITLINKIPLMAYTIQAAIQSNIFDDVIVSTDSQEYAQIAQKHGASVPFLRPKYLAEDTTSLHKVSVHTLKTLLGMGKLYNDFATLQATCPLRNAKDIQNAYEFFTKKKAQAVISVYKTKNPAYTGGSLSKNLSLKKFIPKKYQNVQRQDMKSFFNISGAIFLANVQDYLKIQNPFNMNSYAFQISPEHALDIDSAIDLELAKILINRQS